MRPRAHQYCRHKTFPLPSKLGARPSEAPAGTHPVGAAPQRFFSQENSSLGVHTPKRRARVLRGGRGRPGHPEQAALPPFPPPGGSGGALARTPAGSRLPRGWAEAGRCGPPTHRRWDDRSPGQPPAQALPARRPSSHLLPPAPGWGRGRRPRSAPRCAARRDPQLLGAPARATSPRSRSPAAAMTGRGGGAAGGGRDPAGPPPAPGTHRRRAAFSPPPPPPAVWFPRAARGRGRWQRSGRHQALAEAAGPAWARGAGAHRGRWGRATAGSPGTPERPPSPGLGSPGPWRERPPVRTVVVGAAAWRCGELGPGEHLSREPGPLRLYWRKIIKMCWLGAVVCAFTYEQTKGTSYL